ncbi:MAG: MBL fold metallo-hydrolase [bacterium]
MSGKEINKEEIKQIPEVRLTVVYDNKSKVKGLDADWGFACYIEFGETKLLFDTGDDGKILLNNMKILDINPEEIGLLFLSHEHHDHTGGLKAFLKKNPKVKIYFPQSFPDKLKEKFKESGTVPIPIASFLEIQPNVFTLGEFEGTTPEQALAIRSSKGIIIITGCAHPGIINIIEKAKESFKNESIYLVLGGFHLYKSSNKEIEEVIEKLLDLSVVNVAPTHCTGNKAHKMFKKKYGNYYIEIGAGKIVTIEK